MTKLIERLSDMITEEIEGAKEYATCAIKHKEDMPTLAKTYYDIATDELRHVNLLHGEVTKIIDHHRKEHGDPPAAMLAVYEYLHEKHIKAVAEVKMILQQY